MKTRNIGPCIIQPVASYAIGIDRDDRARARVRRISRVDFNREDVVVV